MVRAVADELGDVAHRGRPRDRLAASGASSRSEVVARARAARCAPLMDLEAVRDAAFCHRHREITREHGKEIARERLERGAAHRRRVGRAVRRRDAARLAPAGDARPHPAARCTRPSQARARPAGDRRSSSRSSSSTRATGTWLLDKPPLMPAQHLPHARRVGGAHRPGARDVRKGLTDERDPSAADHRRALPHRRDPAVEVLRPRAPGQADGLRLPRHRRSS